MRALYVALLLTTIGLGLASRGSAAALPEFVRTYAGDILWATAAYWGLSLVMPQAARARRALGAFGVAVAVEISQLFHPAWLDALRRTRPGGWLLGFGFLWSDLACYAAGVMLAMAVDSLLSARGSLLRRTPFRS